MELPKPLKCSEVGTREILRALLHHELSPQDEDRLLAHLRSCPQCLSIMAAVLSEIRFSDLPEGEARL